MPVLKVWQNGAWAEVAVGGGDVVGPGSATDEAFALFDGTTGKLLKDSLALAANQVLVASHTGALIVVTIDNDEFLARGPNANDDIGNRTVAQVLTALGVSAGADVTDDNFDAKGDILVASAAQTASPLTVGTNGYSLIADSSQSRGVKYGEDKFVLKTADEDVTSSTTLQDDDELVLALTANTTYKLEGKLLHKSGSTTPDIKVAFTFPAGCTVEIFGIGAPAGGTANRTSRYTISGTSRNWASSTGTGAVFLSGTIVVGGTAGSLQLQWAQNTSDANFTRVEDGSYLELTEKI